MKKALLALAVILTASFTAHAQGVTPGTQLTINAAVNSMGFSCGRASYPDYCYGVPTDDGGKFWLDVYYNAAPQYGFIEMFNVADLGRAQVTSAQVTYSKYVLGQSSRTYTLVGAMDVTFNGTTTDTNPDGTPTNQTYSGTGHFTFNYYYGSCSGRGCGIPIVQLMTSGVLTITYN